MTNSIGTIKELKDLQSVTHEANRNQSNKSEIQAQQMREHPNIQPNEYFNDDIGDDLHNLPSDSTPVSDNDRKILNTFFSTQSNQVITEFKDPLTAGLLFIILSLPQTDEIISKFMTYKSPYITILVKTCIFVIGFYLLKNISICKKKS